ncbi:MAG: hypothetical protein ACRDCE_18000 [Cetobacterium sp.]|uniref:hypothetical protein n=1 Tax=Cetobacterium sp. TaxID=2071632 RepID=UPI003EE53301
MNKLKALLILSSIPFIIFTSTTALGKLAAMEVKDNSQDLVAIQLKLMKIHTDLATNNSRLALLNKELELM